MSLSDADQKEALQILRDIKAALPQLVSGSKAAVNFAWEGHSQLGVTDGAHTGENGKLIPKGLNLSFVDWCVQKFGKA